MFTLNHTMTDPLGMHASLVSTLMKFAKEKSLHLSLSFHGQVVPIEDFSQCMALDIRHGDTFVLSIQEDIDHQVQQELEELLKSF